MKKIKLLGFIVLVALCCVSLAACGTFEGYDDDAAIVQGSGFSTVKSVSVHTSSEFTLKCQSSNGVKHIKNITVSENPTFDITLTVESGRFKVVLVKDDSVYTVCDSNTDRPVSTQIPSGEYSLRIVAENANVNFKIKLSSFQ